MVRPSWRHLSLSAGMRSTYDELRITIWRSLAREFRLALEARLGEATTLGIPLPSKDEVAAFCRSYLDATVSAVLRQGSGQQSGCCRFSCAARFQLAEQIVYAMRFDLNCCGKPVPANLSDNASELIHALHGNCRNLRTCWPQIYRRRSRTIRLQAATKKFC